MTTWARPTAGHGLLESRTPWPWIAIVFVLVATAGELHLQGRRWWCACGQPFLWSGEVHSEHTSQHLLDPYSFTHVLHGLLLCGFLTVVARRLTPAWRLWIAVCIESLWEVFENSAFTIERYRTATMSYGYQGDSIANSLGDILSMVVGFVVASRIGWRASIAIFVVTELVLLFWIRDNLVLSILMLVYSIDAIKAWQLSN
jgi:hypothetical protein